MPSFSILSLRIDDARLIDAESVIVSGRDGCEVVGGGGYGIEDGVWIRTLSGG